jgi:TPR repeat protein
MDDPLNMPPITAHLSLMVDAMCLNAAEQAFERATKGRSAVEKAMKKVERLNQRRDGILEKHKGNSHAAYDALEPISIQLESAEYDLGVAHAPVLQALALVHILYRTAADKENPKAQSNLGVCYYNGWGLEKNLEDLARSYRKSAEQGHARAQRNLGVCYAIGAGVPKDLVEAEKWYRKAAQQGDVGAEYNLGVACYKGQGIPKNATEATKWFRAAVEQDHVAAKFNLGVCYLYGEGLAKDEVEAYKWISLAAGQGHADAKKALPTVESQLTAGQTAEGQSRADAYKPLTPSEEGGFDLQ